MDFTCVEIKNIKYIKLISLDRKCEKELDLTTIHRDQELAYLNIFHIDKNKKKTLLKKIEIRNIRPGKSGIPELRLFVSYDGRKYYKIVLKLNGYIYYNSVIDIRQISKSPMRFTNIALIALALIVVSFLAFFSIRSLTGNSEISQKSSVKTDQLSTSQNITETTSTGSSSTGSSSTGSSSTGSSSTGSSSTGSSSTGSSSSVTDLQSNQSIADQTEPQTIEISELINNKAIVYFYPNSIVLTSDAKAVLSQVLSILNENKNLDVEIFGHCAFFGTEKGRQEISTERAENVYSYFTNNGWTPESLPLLVGFGHQNIITRDPGKQDLNRRVEINIMSNTEN